MSLTDPIETASMYDSRFRFFFCAISAAESASPLVDPLTDGWAKVKSMDSMEP
jgi:hypothetical protein